MAKTFDTLTLQNKFKRFYKEQLDENAKKPKARASSAAVFSFLAVSLFAWYAVRPTAQTIIHLRREITDKTDLNKKMEDKITALIEAQTSYEGVQDKLPLVEQALPHNPDGVILARQLRNLAFIANASVSAIQIPSLPLLAQEATGAAKTAAVKPNAEFPLTIVIAGQYPSIRQFLTGLLELRRVTSINTISIKQVARRNEGDGSIQLSIGLKSYYTTQ